MITSILSIIAMLLPWLMELFTADAKKENTNVEFDKAIAEGRTDDLAAMLSARVDRRLPGTQADSNTGRQDPAGPR